jgi:hypothetical protein
MVQTGVRLPPAEGSSCDQTVCFGVVGNWARRIETRAAGEMGLLALTLFSSILWTATASPAFHIQVPHAASAPVREYQIRRSRFPFVSWRLRFELTAMTANSQTQAITIFPQATTDKSTAGWLVLDLK